jgi:hypothetical protein
VNEEPQTLKDAEIEALKKEVEILTEVLRNLRWYDRESKADFENPFAKPHH